MAFDAGAILGHLRLETGHWNKAISKAKADSNSLRGVILRHSQDIRKLGLAMTAVGAGITVVTTKLTNMAAEVEESENLFKESMDGMAKAAYGWSQEVSRALGVNQFEIRKMVGTFNVMLNSMGLAEQQAYNMSTTLTQLTYDMASFYNLRPEDAFLKLQSGISGEVEPLKRLGILVNENTIKQWAYNNSLVETGKQLTEQQKVFARYKVIMEQTHKAQGDLLRTADSYVNVSRRLTSQLEELGATLGESTKGSMTGIKLILLGIVGSIKEWVDTNPRFAGTIMLSIDILGKLLLVLGGIAFVLPSVITGFVVMAPFILPILGSIALAALAVWAAFKYWDEIRAMVWSFAAGVNDALSTALLSLADFVKSIEDIGGLSGVWWKFASNATQALSEVLNKIADYVKAVSQIPGFGALGWGGVLENSLRSAGGQLSTTSQGFTQRIADLAKESNHGVSETIRTMGESARESAELARDNIAEIMSEIVGTNDQTKNLIETASDELTSHVNANLGNISNQATKTITSWEEEWKSTQKSLPKYQKESLDKMAAQFKIYVEQGSIDAQQFQEWYQFQLNKVNGSAESSFNLMEELSTQSARNMQNTFSDLFFDAFTGKLDSAEEAFAAFGQAMLRTVANLMAQQAVQWLFGGDTSSSGTSGGGGWMGGILSLFKGAGKLFGFADGADEVPYTGLFKVHKGEEITPRWGSGSEKNTEGVTIYNLITEEAIASAMQSQEGEDVIVNVINENSLRNGVIRREVVRR